MRRIDSLKLTAAAILLVGITSFAFIVTAMLDAVEVTLSELPRNVDVERVAVRANNVVVIGNRNKSVFPVAEHQTESKELQWQLLKPAYSTAAVGENDEPDIDGRRNMKPITESWLLNQLPVSDSASIWPSSVGPKDDRILAQLKYVPRSYNRSHIKVIYLPAGLGDLPPGRSKFISDRCPVDACWLTSSSRHDATAHIRLLQGDAFFDSDVHKPINQIWVLWLLESPENTPQFRNAERMINWTATYRPDSTIVTPYEKYVHFDKLGISLPPYRHHQAPSNTGLGSRPIIPAEVRPIRSSMTMKNYAAGRTGLVAWFVSNCFANNRRYTYVQQLRQYIPVDVYGDCGDLQCPRTHKAECDRMIRRRYKFYLAFENSNCEDYITEKFFRNALWNDVVPIVMGARKSEYEAVAPPRSFIHVDDFMSPQHLASYLLRLNSTDRQYNEYMAWKTPYTGRFVDTRFWCRLCAMAHDDSQHVTWYNDISKWWRNRNTCTMDRWPKQTINSNVVIKNDFVAENIINTQ